MLKLIKETGYAQVPSGGRRKLGLFKCQCGNTKEMCISNVNRGAIKSCGCLLKENTRKLGLRTGKDKASYKHGMFGSKIYNTYYGIIFRTRRGANNSRHYGDRGIKCEWSSFEDFYKDMKDSYTEHVKKYGERQTTIDRINPNGNYCMSNCRWATYAEQGVNRRNNVFLTINNETKHLSEWKRILKLDGKTIKKRYQKKEV